MKINVNYIYWLLLFVSIVSSSLLFMIVASEDIITSSVPASAIALHEEINNTDSGVNPNHHDFSQEAVNEPESNGVLENDAEIHSSFEETTTPPEKTNNQVPILTDAVSHNSGFIDGFSDTGQIILTLVDTATAELGDDVNIDKKNLQATAPGDIEITNNSSQIPIVPIKHSTSNLSENLVTKLKPLHVFETPDNTQDINITSEINLEELDDDAPKEDSNKPVEGVADYLSNVSEIPGIKETEEFQKSTIGDNILTTNEVQKQVSGEDIPSFSEWAQKQLEEAEKKKEVSNTSVQNQQGSLKSNSNLKLRSKNYASPDCGAKIIAANPESTTPGAVLSSSRDEYMLNTCTSRIWFVVELCEAIQGKKIELANFELFSSSPKNFSVHVSDRFPTRDWSTVGQFTAKDERDIQNFSLDPHIFGKYVKVELHSHYGSEHFCPISLFRIYGTSEFEVLDTEDQMNSPEDTDDDDDDGDEFDEKLNSDKGQVPSDLFGSARDAVLKLVQKAAEVLVITKDHSNHTDQRTIDYSLSKIPILEKCQTPSHVVVCDNCSDLFFGNVYGLLSCRNDFLNNLSESIFIMKVLLETDTCVEYGLYLNSKQTSTESQSTSRAVVSFLRPEYVAALCNIRAIKEKKVLLNTSNSLYANLTSNPSSDFGKKTVISKPLIEMPPKVISSNSNEEQFSDALQVNISEEPEIIKSSTITKPSGDESSTIQIQPTKTYKGEDSHEDTIMDSISVPESSISTSETNIFLQPITHIPSSTKTSTEKVSDLMEDKKLSTKELLNIIPEKELTKELPTENRTMSENDKENGEPFDMASEHLETLFSEFEQDQNTNSIVTTTVTPPSSNSKQQGQKESIFVRLYNRIKALETNMSLSSQYLEELSRRYKKQMEEMQRAFEKTLAAVNEESLRSEEYRKRNSEEFNRIHDQLQKLSFTVDLLMSERNSWFHIASWFIYFFISQLCVAAVILYFCGKSDTKIYEESSEQNENIISVPKRRKSVDVIGHEIPAINKRRRPSEEALNICGTYEELLIPDITDIDSGLMFISKSKRKRKKNSILRKSNSNNNLNLTSSLQENEIPSTKLSLEKKCLSQTEQYPQKRKKRSTEMTGFQNGITIEDISPLDTYTTLSSLQNKERNVEQCALNITYSQEPIIISHQVNGNLKPKIISPNYIKTAVSERSKRMSMTDNSSDSSSSFNVDNTGRAFSVEISTEKQVSKLNGLKPNSKLNRSLSLNGEQPLIEKKDKKSSGGFKKIFKKVF